MHADSGVMGVGGHGTTKPAVHSCEALTASAGHGDGSTLPPFLLVLSSLVVGKYWKILAFLFQNWKDLPGNQTLTSLQPHPRGGVRACPFAGCVNPPLDPSQGPPLSALAILHSCFMQRIEKKDLCSLFVSCRRWLAGPDFEFASFWLVLCFMPGSGCCSPVSSAPQFPPSPGLWIQSLCCLSAVCPKPGLVREEAGPS